MINIVKLTLICQVKDRDIPQLIPLIWIFSTLIIILLLIIVIDFFFYKILYKFIFNKDKLINKLSFSFKW